MEFREKCFWDLLTFRQAQFWGWKLKIQFFWQSNQGLIFLKSNENVEISFTVGPCLLRISILRLIRTFQTYLAYSIFVITNCNSRCVEIWLSKMLTTTNDVSAYLLLRAIVHTYVHREWMKQGAWVERKMIPEEPRNVCKSTANCVERKWIVALSLA